MNALTDAARAYYHAWRNLTAAIDATPNATKGAQYALAARVYQLRYDALLTHYRAAGGKPNNHDDSELAHADDLASTVEMRRRYQTWWRTHQHNDGRHGRDETREVRARLRYCARRERQLLAHLAHDYRDNGDVRLHAPTKRPRASEAGRGL